MKKLLPFLLLLALANCSLLKKEPTFLFVQSAKTATYDGKVLKLNNFTKNVVLFSNRPQRITAEMSNADFAKMWNNNKQKNSFKKDPPNSAISYIDEKGNLKSAIVENSDLKVTKNSLHYNVKVLSGKLSKNMKDVTLFIDNESCHTMESGITVVLYCGGRPSIISGPSNNIFNP